MTAPRAIVHVDMDAFYASVEQRDDPRLRGQPVIVGGHPTRGVVLAASYEVRPFGVRSAMPMSQAVRLAPKAIVVPPRPRAYAEASEQVFEIFERYTPQVEPLSLDEAFLDVTASRSLFGTPAAIATALRADIAREVKLNASAGIAETKFVAKVASDFAKPNGQHEVPPGTAKAFLHPLSVSRLWGIGAKTLPRLEGLGIRTVGDLAARSPEWLELNVGSGAAHWWALAQGHDDRPVISDREAKSIGAQDTFEEDVLDKASLKPQIHGQAVRVARRLRRSGLKARCVQLSIKYADFSLITRRKTMASPSDDGQTLYRVAEALLEALPLERRVRLTGVSAQELVTEVPAAQLGLFEAPAGPSRTARLNEALDRITTKYGSTAVATADLAEAGTADEGDRAMFHKPKRP